MLISSHGTVLVTIGTKEGFVLAADSLQTRGKEILSDKKQKIYAIRKFVACSLTGRTEVSATEGDFKMEYNLHREIGAYANAASASSVQQHAEDIADWFYRKIDPLYAKFPWALEDWRQKTVGRESLITINIVGYHQKIQPRWFEVTFPPDLEFRDGVRRLARPLKPHQLPFKYFGIQKVGVVIESLLDKTQASYPDCRELDTLKKYYKNMETGNVERTTLKDGIELARTLIECAIRHSPPEAGVGGEVQMAVVERRKGFRWLSRLSDDWV